MPKLIRLWQSPTLTTFGSLAAKLGGGLLLLPLVAAQFTTAEVAVWLMLMTIASLQVIADFGFSQTYSRAIPQVRGGRTIAQLQHLGERSTKVRYEDTHDELLRLYVSSRRTYRSLAIASVMFLMLTGFAVWRPIESLPNPFVGWECWLLVCATTSFTVFGCGFTSVLLGLEQVATLRRWEMLFSLFSTLSAVVALQFRSGLLVFVIAQQAWVVMTVFRNWALCNRDATYRQSAKNEYDPSVLAVLWPSAWRSASGVLLSFGLIQASTFIVAIVCPIGELATYLLGLRCIQAVSQLSQSPFYSKLPSFSRLFAEGKSSDLLQRAKRGMFLAHSIYGIGFVLIGIAAPLLLNTLNSEVKFPASLVWVIFGLAFYLERFGAMHLQLYTLTNHIIWHTANGWTGFAMILLSGPSVYFLGPIGFPLVMATSYACVYDAICVSHSYREFGLSFWKYDSFTFLLPLIGSFTVYFLFSNLL